MQLTPLQEAQSPSTTPKRLQELAQEFLLDNELIQAVLQNPNSTKELLAKISPNNPLALLGNVSLPLFCLEEPNFLAPFPFVVSTDLAKEPSTPMWLLEACYRGHCRQGELSNPTLYTLLAKRPALSPFLLEQLSLCPHRQTLTVLLQRPELPVNCVERMLYSPFQGVRRAAAKHPNAPTESLVWLRRAGASEWLDVYQAPDLSVTSSELESLCSKGFFGARLAVRHPNFPVETLPALLHEKHDLVSSALKNPNAPSVLLSQHKREYGRLVAKHPNTPQEELFRIIILTHPAMAKSQFDAKARSLALQNPSAPQGLAQLCRRVEAKDESLTEGELRELASYSEYAKWLALSHPNASAQWLQESWRDYNIEEIAALAKHPNASAQLIESLDNFDPAAPIISTRPYNDRLSLIAMSHPLYPKERLNSLVEPVLRLRLVGQIKAISQNPNLSPENLSKIVAASLGKDGWGREFWDALVQNKRLSSVDLRGFVSSRKWRIRAVVARHPNTAPDDLQILAEDAIPEVRIAASKNPALPAAFLRSLVDLGATYDLFALSCRRVSLTNEQLQALLWRGPFARMLAAKSCGEDQTQTLEALCQDKHPRVREAAAQNPNLSEAARARMLQQSNYYTRAAVAQNPRATTKELGVEAEHRHDGSLLLRKAIASHLNAPTERLRDLSWRPSTIVEVARNPSTPVDCLEKLAKSKFSYVRRAVALHPNTPKALLQKLLQRPLLMPLETARLRLEISIAQHQRRDAKALLPVFQSNPNFLELDEGKREFSLEDTQKYLERERQREGSLVFLIYHKAPSSTRRDQGPKELLFAGEELIATACYIDRHPSEPYPWLGLFLLHSQCHRQGLGQECMIAMERFFYSRGFRELRLGAFQENEGAVLFWQKLGYQTYEESKHLLGRRLWKMRKPLI